MFERLLLVTVIGATCVPVAACDTSEAAPSLPAPVRRDAGPADAEPSADAHVADAETDAGVDAGVDAGMPDAGVRRRRPPRDAGVDAGIIDAGVSDASAPDAPVIDAPVIDAPVIDAPVIDAPPVDAHDILLDASEAPPLYDARILM